MAGKKYLLNQPYFKPNYYEAVKYIVPQYLTDDDIESFGKTTDPKDLVINSHIRLANDLSSALTVSGVENTAYSGISSLEGITPYFIKQNELTDITPDLFERKILNKLSRSFLDFTTSADFYTYISGTLLPSIRVNDPTAKFESSHSPSDTHIYLIENLSWMYFLNTTGTNYNPHEYVSETIAKKLYPGNSIQLNDALKGVAEHTWKNGLGFYPSIFASSTDSYLSGTQQLDKLKTWIDVIYSPLYADRADFTVRDRFESFSDYGLLTQEEIPNGPFTRFLRALSFFAFDINNINETLGSLYDLDDCPDEYLPLVAELIGWDLFGSDPSRWRLQLRNAVKVYKAAGTKRGFQIAMNSVFPKDVIPVETYVTELHESYIPYLIYYALATESSYFKSPENWTNQLAVDMKVSGYTPSSVDTNIRYVVDRILYETYEKFSAYFEDIPGKENGFFYRGRLFPMPPFEEYPYYVNFELNKDIIYFIADRLACFGVRDGFVRDFISYVTTNTLDNDDEPRTSSFLFFTSGYNEAPNVSRLVSDLSNEKFEYVSLWSGKSSHFKVVLDASSYDFNKTGLDLSEPNSGDAFKIAARITRKFAPGHAIPLVNLELAHNDPLDVQDTKLVPLILPNKVEVEQGKNYFSKALNLNSYKRGLNPGGTVIHRSSTKSKGTSEIRNGSLVTTIPRTSIRRRSYEKLMPFNGYYDRTGFNMPVKFNMDTEPSAVTLGMIPSSLTFTPIPDHVNLPAVWSQCEDFNSVNKYYEYSVSNTLATRGDKPTQKKNLVIFAGQSNMNGRGTSAVDPITGVNWYNYDTDSFSSTIVPLQNTDINTQAGDPDLPVTFGSRPYWGPEIRFAQRLKERGDPRNTYMLKFCTDNSWVIDPTAKNVKNLSGAATAGTYISPGVNSNWCPSSDRLSTLWDRFASSIGNCIEAMGGMSQVSSVYLMWNQGETEAARGQDSNSIAALHRAATEYFLDNARTLFPEQNFRILRVLINNSMGDGSEPDWLYYPNGLYSNFSSCLNATGGGCKVTSNEELATALYGQSTSDPGSYGNWSWSSLPTVRSGQQAMNTSRYGYLLDVDTVAIDSADGGAAGPAASGAAVGGFTQYIAGAGFQLSATQYYVEGEYQHQNIHYTSDGVTILGERLYDQFELDLSSLTQVSSQNVRLDRGDLPGIYSVMHSAQEKRKLIEAKQSYGIVDSYTNSVSNVYQSYANSATENGGFPNSISDYYNYSFGRDLHRLYKIYATEFNRHQLNPGIQKLDGANLFSHIFGPTLFNHDFEKLSFDSNSILVSSLSAVTEMSPYSPAFQGSMAYIASGANDMYLDTFERVLSGAVSGVELIHTSGSLENNSFSLFRVNNLFKKTTDDPYMFDNTFVMSRSSIGGLPRVRFNLKKYNGPSDRPIRTNFLLPDHEHRVSVRTLVSDNLGVNFGGRQIGIWLHTAPELGEMWSYTKNGWEQHSALVGRSNVVRDYSHIFTMPLRTKDEVESEVNRLECIDLVVGGPTNISPVSRLRKEDFEELTLDFHTINRHLVLPREYRANTGLLHRRDQNYIIEVFLLPNGQNDKFMLLDAVEVQNMTLKKLSEMFVNGKYQDPLCVMPNVIGNCPENRVEFSKDDIRKVFRFFNNISGKNSAVGLASRDKNETKAIMGPEGGSRLDYRRKVAFDTAIWTQILGTSIFGVLNQINIDV